MFGYNNIADGVFTRKSGHRSILKSDQETTFFTNVEFASPKSSHSGVQNLILEVQILERNSSLIERANEIGLHVCEKRTFRSIFDIDRQTKLLIYVKIHTVIRSFEFTLFYIDFSYS